MSVLFTWIKAKFPITALVVVFLSWIKPQLTCVDKRDASVISKLPLTIQDEIL